MVLESQARWQEAEEQWQDILRLEERALVVYHPCRLSSMQSLAYCLAEQNKHDKAKDVLRQIVRLQERDMKKIDERIMVDGVAR